MKNDLKIKYIFLLIIFFGILGLAKSSLADTHSVTCSGTITTALQNAINAATGGTTYADGDIVSVGAGTCTAGALSLNKKITLQGAGSSSTHLTLSGQLTIQDSAPRITGFDLTATGVWNIYIGESTVHGVNGFRIDNNIITGSGSTTNIIIRGNTSSPTLASHPTGLIDNNQLNYGQIQIHGDTNTPAETNGDEQWYLSDGYGAATNVVVMEANTFYASSFTDYAFDSNYGSRYVMRFNTFTNRQFAHHGVQGTGQRANAHAEIYNNNVGTHEIWLRSGGGPIFNNTAGQITVDDQVSTRYGAYEGTGECGMGCDGTNPRDGNRTGMHGYPCRDQIGRGGGDLTKGHTGDNQRLSPLYSWNNKTGGGSVLAINVFSEQDLGTCTPTISYTAEHVQANRDYYNSASGIQTSKTSPFNGTSGVGWGTLANRPDTCTTNANEAGGGVGYWATDEGSWNQSGSGGQGLFYRCSATNTWTLAYTPLVYPHPLAGGEVDTTPPAKPTGLSVS